jgi:glycolate oxidase FAD binding subunit
MPAHEATVMLELSESAALQQFQLWMRQAEPVSATCWRDGRVWLRLSGSHAGVHEAAARLGGEALDADDALSFWRALRDHADAWFGAHMPLWRLSLPAMAEPLALAGEQTMEWGGALRWLQTSLPADEVQARTQQLGGHATLFRGGDRAHNVFTPLSAPILAIHRRLKQAFDPAGIFNPGRLVPGL